MCFSMGWLQSFLIWLVIIAAIFAILKLVIPWVLSKIGVDAGIVIQIMSIILWAFIAIAVIYLAFAAISCLGGISFPPLPHR